MVLGMSISTFTTVHVVLSLVGIAAGLVWLLGLVRSQHLGRWTALFLATTVLTSVTGFMFPFEKVLPSHVFGVVSLALLAVTLPALYAFQLSGRWRWLYVVTGMIALYLNCVVAIVQAFLKIAPLRALAPTQTEAPFLAAQALLLVAFVALGFRALKRFHPDATRPALRAGLTPS